MLKNGILWKLQAMAAKQERPIPLSATRGELARHELRVLTRYQAVCWVINMDIRARINLEIPKRA